jgi:hypothetical protein
MRDNESKEHYKKAYARREESVERLEKRLSLRTTFKRK